MIGVFWGEGEWMLWGCVFLCHTFRAVYMTQCWCSCCCVTFSCVKMVLLVASLRDPLMCTDFLITQLTQEHMSTPCQKSRVLMHTIWVGGVLTSDSAPIFEDNRQPQLQASLCFCTCSRGSNSHICHALFATDAMTWWPPCASKRPTG